MSSSQIQAGTVLPTGVRESPAALAALAAAPANCPNCGEALAEEQRYCLSCGEPVSSLRLTFLDALRPDPAGAAAADRGARLGPSGPAEGPLRRHAGSIGLVAILLLGALIGLLVGHWTTAGAKPGRTVVTVSAPAGFTAGGSSTGTPNGGSAAGTANGGSGSAGSAKEAGNTAAAHGETGSGGGEGSQAPAKPVKANLEKLSHSTGKQHREEIEKATESLAPIETG